MRALILFLLFTSALFANGYSELLIKAQSEIFPKLLLLDTKLDAKLVGGEVVYTIVYEDEDAKTAEAVRQEILARYGKGLGDYRLRVELLDVADMGAKIDASAVYVLNVGERIVDVVNAAIAGGAMTFSYDFKNLNNGVLLSMMIEKFTVLYLNVDSMKSYPVDFVDSIYQIAAYKW